VSAKAINWAVKQTTGSPVAKTVLILLAEHYSEAWGRAWPSQQTLAREAELSERSVRNAITALAVSGLVHVELWKYLSGTKAGNRYYLPRYRSDVKRASFDDGPVIVEAQWAGHMGKRVIVRWEDGAVLQESG